MNSGAIVYLKSDKNNPARRLMTVINILDLGRVDNGQGRARDGKLSARNAHPNLAFT